MKVYKAIVWFSILMIIGELLMFTGFEIAPISAKPTGLVLGKKTDIFLEQTADQLYPAAYYRLDDLKVTKQEEIQEKNVPTPTEHEKMESSQEVVAVEPEEEAELEAELEAEEEQGVEAETSPNQELDQVIEVLDNTPSEWGVNQNPNLYHRKEQVQNLVNKNKRFYLQHLKKELKGVSNSLEP